MNVTDFPGYWMRLSGGKFPRHHLPPLLASDGHVIATAAVDFQTREDSGSMREMREVFERVVRERNPDKIFIVEERDHDNPKLAGIDSLLVAFDRSGNH